VGAELPIVSTAIPGSGGGHGRVKWVSCIAGGHGDARGGDD
jgi:hypothetical protein